MIQGTVIIILFYDNLVLHCLHLSNLNMALLDATSMTSLIIFRHDGKICDGRKKHIPMVFSSLSEVLHSPEQLCVCSLPPSLQKQFFLKPHNSTTNFFLRVNTQFHGFCEKTPNLSLFFFYHQGIHIPSKPWLKMGCYLHKDVWLLRACWNVAPKSNFVASWNSSVFFSFGTGCIFIHFHGGNTCGGKWPVHS